MLTFDLLNPSCLSCSGLLDMFGRRLHCLEPISSRRVLSRGCADDVQVSEGPWLVTADEIPDPNNLDLKIEVDGEVRQDSNTRNMILDVGQFIEFASAFYTLHPGDIIMTGTPEGVSPIVPGNIITATIGRVGSMQVKVRAA